MSIRTTITLDEDVITRVKQVSQTNGKSFKATINDLLRSALLTSAQKPVRTFKITPTRMGFNPGLNHDSIEALLEYGEGELHR